MNIKSNRDSNLLLCNGVKCHHTGQEWAASAGVERWGWHFSQNHIWDLHPDKARGQRDLISDQHGRLRTHKKKRKETRRSETVPDVCRRFGDGAGDQTRRFLRGGVTVPCQGQCSWRVQWISETDNREKWGDWRVHTRRNCRLLAALTKISMTVIWPSLPLCPPTLSELLQLVEGSEGSRLSSKVALRLNLTPEGLFGASNRGKSKIKITGSTRGSGGLVHPRQSRWKTGSRAVNLQLWQPR